MPERERLPGRTGLRRLRPRLHDRLRRGAALQRRMLRSARRPVRRGHRQRRVRQHGRGVQCLLGRDADVLGRRVHVGLRQRRRRDLHRRLLLLGIDVRSRHGVRRLRDERYVHGLHRQPHRERLPRRHHLRLRRGERLPHRPGVRHRERHVRHDLRQRRATLPATAAAARRQASRHRSAWRARGTPRAAAEAARARGARARPRRAWPARARRHAGRRETGPAAPARAALSSGQCETVGLGTACGAGCVDCTGNATGSACVAGVCGCTLATDCPVQHSCSAAHTCTTVCNGGGCNGGCCSRPGLVPSQCTAGTTDTECGGNGGQCILCGGTTHCTANVCQ